MVPLGGGSASRDWRPHYNEVRPHASLGYLKLPCLAVLGTDDQSTLAFTEDGVEYIELSDHKEHVNRHPTHTVGTRGPSADGYGDPEMSSGSGVERRLDILAADFSYRVINQFLRTTTVQCCHEGDRVGGWAGEFPRACLEGATGQHHPHVAVEHKVTLLEAALVKRATVEGDPHPGKALLSGDHESLMRDLPHNATKTGLTQ
jgi:hypothetical protein